MQMISILLRSLRSSSFEWFLFI